MTSDTHDVSPSGPFWQFSLRALLVAVALVALACVALKFASPAWSTTLSACTLLLFMSAAVVALVDRGPRQAFAIGLVAYMAIYGILFVMTIPSYSGPLWGASGPTTSPELNPGRGNLPTSKILYPLFRLLSELPPRREFMLVGHLLWMLLFGYVGGQFARFVYRRRVSAEQARRRDRPGVS